MKYFKKQTAPLSLTRWLTAYENELRQRYNSTQEIDEIWEALGQALDEIMLSESDIQAAKMLKNQIHKELDQSLLAEQGYICCYCGKRIPENNVFVREHFLDKSKHRKLVFQYENLNPLITHRFRRLAYEKGQQKVGEIQTIIDAVETNEERKDILKSIIEDEIYNKLEGKLDPFCFVTASILWNAFF